MPSVDPKQAQFINERIVERYGVNWMVDNLPVADVALMNADGTVRTNSLGFPLGTILDTLGHRIDPPALYNHLSLIHI